MLHNQTQCNNVIDFSICRYADGGQNNRKPYEKHIAFISRHYDQHCLVIDLMFEVELTHKFLQNVQRNLHTLCL